MSEERSLLLRLGIKPDNVGKLQATFGQITRELKQQGVAAGYLGRMKDAMESVTKELQAQQQANERIAVAMQPEVVAARHRLATEQAILATRLKTAHVKAAGNDPRGIRQQVTAQLALEKAQHEYQKKASAERRRQQGFFGRVGAGYQAGGVRGAAGAAVEGAGGALAAVGAATGAVVALGAVISKAVSAANPAMWQMLSEVMDDLWATVGQAVMPIFQTWVEQLRFFADLIATIIPDQSAWQEIIEAQRPEWEAIKQVLTDLAPYIRNVLVGALTLWAKVMQQVAASIAVVISFMEGLSGLDRNTAGLKSSRFRSASSTTTTNDNEEIGKRLRQNAYGLGVVDPQQQMVDRLKNIDETTKDIRDIVARARQFGSDLAAAGGEAGKFMREGPAWYLGEKVYDWLHG